MDRLPDVVTHNFDPARGPFRNLCALPDAEAERVLDEIRASGTRRIKADYLRRRRAVEDWLRAERRRKLGQKLGTTRLDRPIYFFLGDFADGLDRSRPASLVLPLAAFPPEVLTFTYPDSMASLPLSRDDRLRAHRKAYHGKVFTLPEIAAVVARFGLPGDRWKPASDRWKPPSDRWKTEESMCYDRFIEVQVWDDRPLRSLPGLRPGAVLRPLPRGSGE